jgi:hypothetical protein
MSFNLLLILNGSNYVLSKQMQNVDEARIKEQEEMKKKQVEMEEEMKQKSVEMEAKLQK